MHTHKCLVASIFWALFILFTIVPVYAEQPKVILITGFEPFGGDATNGSWEAVQHLTGKRFDNMEMVVAQLPVVWGEAAEKLQSLIKANKPVSVISFGQAGEEPVRLETTAHNVRGRIRDNKRMMPRTSQIYINAPLTLETSLPVNKIENRLRAAGIPVRVSQDAGTYLCNDIFYTLMYDSGFDTTKNIPRGFIHVPPLNARVLTGEGNIVIFDKRLLQKTAEIIIQTIVEYAK